MSGERQCVSTCWTRRTQTHDVIVGSERKGLDASAVGVVEDHEYHPVSPFCRKIFSAPPPACAFWCLFRTKM